MHPICPTLSAMVNTVTAEAQRAARLPVDPGELERYAHRVLNDLQRGGPRITDYLPALALKQVLTLLRPQPHAA